jgi:transcriptional regulator with XRE-family HTH domain
MTSHQTTVNAPGAVGATQARALGRHRLGADLRRLRQAQSLRLEDVAAQLELVPSTLSRIETGQAPVKTAYLTAMLDLYHVHDPAERERLTSLAHDGRQASWHHSYRPLLPAGASHYLDLETLARHIRSYTMHAIPGLVQAPGYAAAVIHATRPSLTGSQVSDLVTLQARRQGHSRASGHRLHLIVDESALLRPFGTPAIMSGQFRHLLTLTTDPAITVQVAELATPRPVLTPPFTILSFPDPASLDTACTTGIGGQITITTNPADLRTLHAAFTAITGNAATTDDTATLIKDTTAHWERQAHHDR